MGVWFSKIWCFRSVNKELLGRCKLINLPCQAGNLSSSLIFVNDTFGSGLLKDRNGFCKSFVGLLHRVTGHSFSDSFNSVLGRGFVALVSYSPDLALPGTFKC